MNNIAHWIESLPAEALFALVMALSAVVAGLCLRIRLRMVRWALALVIPFVIAWCLYWMPVWVGNDPSEHAAWAPLFVVLWGPVGCRCLASRLYCQADNDACPYKVAAA